MFKGKEKRCCLRKMEAKRGRQGRKWKRVKVNDNIEQKNKKDCTVYLCLLYWSQESYIAEVHLQSSPLRFGLVL